MTWLTVHTENSSIPSGDYSLVVETLRILALGNPVVSIICDLSDGMLLSQSIMFPILKKPSKSLINSATGDKRFIDKISLVILMAPLLFFRLCSLVYVIAFVLFEECDVSKYAFNKFTSTWSTLVLTYHNVQRAAIN